MRRPVGVPFERDRRDADRRRGSEPVLEIVEAGVTGCEPEPPAVVGDDDVDVFRILERRQGACERRLIERPHR